MKPAIPVRIRAPQCLDRRARRLGSAHASAIAADARHARADVADRPVRRSPSRPGGGPTIQGPASGPLTVQGRAVEQTARLADGVRERRSRPATGRRCTRTPARTSRSVRARGRAAVPAAATRSPMRRRAASRRSSRAATRTASSVGAAPARLMMLQPSRMERFFDQLRGAAGRVRVDPDAFGSIGAEVGMERGRAADGGDAPRRASRRSAAAARCATSRRRPASRRRPRPRCP